MRTGFCGKVSGPPHTDLRGNAGLVAGQTVGAMQDVVEDGETPADDGAADEEYDDDDDDGYEYEEEAAQLREQFQSLVSPRPWARRAWAAAGTTCRSRPARR